MKSPDAVMIMHDIKVSLTKDKGDSNSVIEPSLWPMSTHPFGRLIGRSARGPQHELRLLNKKILQRQTDEWIYHNLKHG